jgi:hypothetical protein
LRNAKNLVGLTLLLVPQWALCAEAERPTFDVVFRVPFEDNFEWRGGGSAGQPCIGSEGIKFVEGKTGRAAFFGDGQFVEFRGLPRLDPRSMTLEFWVKPEFELRELDEHYFLRLLSDDGKSGLDVFFCVENCGFRAVVTAGAKKAYVDADNSFLPRKWNQVVVSWDTSTPDLTCLRLYVNGALKNTEQSFPAMKPPDLIRLGCKSKTEGSFAKAAIDELCLYNRCLTELQVLELYRNVDRGPEKVELIRKRIAEDDATAKARMADFLKNHKMAMVVGRTVGGLSDKFFQSLGFPLPEKIHEKDFETADLSKYDILFFPGGGGFVFTEKAQQRLRDFITNGGGYVGICAGAYAAKTFKLVDCNYFPFRERGMVKLDLKKHPITEGFSQGRKMAVRHANGPFIEPSKDVQVPVFYKCGPPYAAIVVKEYGKGRVVVISPHPESNADSLPLVRNSFFWAAKVIGKDEK